MGLWLVQECRRAFERLGNRMDYASLTRLAESSEPFRTLVDPNHPSFLNPADMPAAICEVARGSGQPVPETNGQLIRCTLESLALKYRQVLRGIQQLTGTPVNVLHVVGGGARNELLNRFTSEACGVPVVAGPVEATALGNVLIQARTAGDIGSLAEIREIVRRSSELTTFPPRDAASWDQAAERFQQLQS
jgi:rhamnulokinase